MTPTSSADQPQTRTKIMSSQRVRKRWGTFLEQKSRERTNQLRETEIDGQGGRKSESNKFHDKRAATRAGRTKVKGAASARAAN